MPKEIINKDFIRNRISQIRQEKGASARSLSLDLGYSSEATNQIETGRANPTLEYIMTFCDHFGLTIGEFFNEELTYPIQLKELIKKLGTLNSAELATVSDMVTHLTKKK